MKYLVDTNVLAEALRPEPDAMVARWFESTPDDRLFLSVISIAEIRRGLVLLPPGKRRARLEYWLINELLPQYNGRILNVDAEVSLCWGDLMASKRSQGSAAHVLDSFLAATAIVHDCVVVTRNVRDFVGVDVDVVNPWRPVAAD